MNFNISLSAEELRELETFLVSREAPETSLDLPGLNGFLAAVALTPAPVLPSQWIPLVWDPQEGTEAPEFADMNQAQRIMGLLMRYYNEVVGEIDAGDFAPLFYAKKQEDGSEVWDAEPWATGFMFGVKHFAEAWDPLLAGHMERVAPMVMLGTERGREAVCNSADPENARRMARDAIGAAVADLNAQALPLRRQALHASPRTAEPQRRAEPKVGRNDPCPCGSGKKFKKCCGADGTLH